MAVPDAEETGDKQQKHLKVSVLQFIFAADMNQ